MLRRLPLVVVGLLLAFATILVGYPALLVARAADPPNVALSVVPATAELPANDKTLSVVIVARNDLGGEISDAVPSLSDFTDAPVKLVGAEPGKATIASPGEQAWTVKLASDGTAARDGSVIFRLGYRWKGQDRAAFVSLPLKASRPATPEAIDDVAAVTVTSSAAMVDEARPGTVFVAVTNKLDRRITVKLPKLDSSICNGKDCVTILWLEMPPPIGSGTPTPVVTPTPEKGKNPEFYVEPNATKVFTYLIGPNRSGIAPGKHLVSVSVPIDWQPTNGPVDGKGYEGNIVATKEVELGVLGQGEVLAGLSTTSVGLIPGVGFLIAVWLLYMAFNGVKKADGFPLKPATVPFLVAALVISLLAPTLYFIATGRNYLAAYNTTDILLLAVYGAVLAFISYAVIAVALWQGVPRWEKYWHTRNEAERQDRADPIECLKTLHRMRFDLRLHRVATKDGDETVKGFVLQKPHLLTRELWVGPGMQITMSPGQQLPDDVMALLSEPHDQNPLTAVNDWNQVLVLANRLAALQAVHSLKVTWRVENNLTGPQKLKRVGMERLHDDCILTPAPVA